MLRTKAATLIQAILRGRKVRRELLETQRTQTIAATQIQAIWKKFKPGLTLKLDLKAIDQVSPRPSPEQYTRMQAAIEANRRHCKTSYPSEAKRREEIIKTVNRRGKIT